MSRLLQAGERYRITRIERHDPDAYAVIHYGERWAFPCGQSWYEHERPAVGLWLRFGSDNHWHVEQPEAPQ